MKNLQLIRAELAFSIVKGITDTIEQQKFLSLARRAPTMFQTNGLLATWAFLLKKSRCEHTKIMESIIEYFQIIRLNDLNQTNPKTIFLNWIGHDMVQPLSGQELMIRTREAIIFSGWLKRAAEAYCDAGGDE